MDFFKSVFTPDPPPSIQQSPPQPKPEPSDQAPAGISPAKSNASAASGGWSFGGLIKTLSASSESVISTYRRDLQEFRSGLQKETAVIRHAINGIPVSFEASASAAHGSIESVGRAIDGFGASVWHGTAGIISQGKEAFLSSDQGSDGKSDAPTRYSRFESEVVAIQSDLRTFCEDPDDLDDYRRWRSGLVLDEREREIDDLSGENGVLEGVYTILVPETVDHETFWNRYFYRVYKLKQAEDARADLVKRAISGEDKEGWSWEVEDDANETEHNVALERKHASPKKVELEKKGFFAGSESLTEKKSDTELVRKETSMESEDDDGKVQTSNVKMEGNSVRQHIVNDGEKLERSEGKMGGKADPGESSKDSIFSASHDDEELGWDEIEDIGDSDEEKMGSVVKPSGVDLRKRLSAVAVEEDLSWDIEDDDEPAKNGLLMK